MLIYESAIRHMRVVRGYRENRLEAVRTAVEEIPEENTFITKRGLVRSDDNYLHRLSKKTDKVHFPQWGQSLSGKPLTQSQVNRYMNSRQSGDTQQQSADKAGISVRTGRRIEKGDLMPNPFSNVS